MRWLATALTLVRLRSNVLSLGSEQQSKAVASHRTPNTIMIYIGTHKRPNWISLTSFAVGVSDNSSRFSAFRCAF